MQAGEDTRMSSRSSSETTASEPNSANAKRTCIWRIIKHIDADLRWIGVRMSRECRRRPLAACPEQKSEDR